MPITVRTQMVSALLVIMMVLIIPAKGEEDSLKVSGPKEAYLRYIRAIRTNDEATAKEFFEQGKGYDERIIFTQLLLAGNAFQDALLKRFGKETATKFIGQSDGQIEKLEAFIAEPETKVGMGGGYAQISRIPDKPGPVIPIGFAGEMQILLRNHDGKWKQHVTSSEGSEEELEMMKNFTKMLNELASQILSDESLTEAKISEAVEKFRPKANP